MRHILDVFVANRFISLVNTVESDMYQYARKCSIFCILMGRFDLSGGILILERISNLYSNACQIQMRSI